MAQYEVAGYLVITHTVTVEADNEEDARVLGSNLLSDGIGREGYSEWQDHYDVWER
jgi:hypothetical protein